MRRLQIAAIVAVALALGVALPAPSRGRAADSVGFTPLMDMAQQTYLVGFQGGLYEGGTNSVPPDHVTAGMTAVAQVQPLDGNGNASPAGKIVLLSVGMSNTTQEFCSASSALPCDSFTFMAQAAADASVNHTSLVVVNGAAGGQAASTWDSSTDPNYDRVRDTRLTPAGVTERQVQAVWVKVANPGPAVSLPSASADAYALEISMGNIVRTLKLRYPNVRLVFLSSRIYAGYATSTLNPEPYAYESGFAVKWLIQAQVDQTRNGGAVVDARAGDLSYGSVAPWIAWGPYLWADGLTPRSDGLVWQVSDFSSDGTHPSAPSGRQKVATMLLDFFKSSSFTQPWFLGPSSTPTPTPAATPTPTPAPAPGDSDGDGVPDTSDDCPNWFNPAQILPPWPVPVGDPDCDGFATTRETFIGTDAARHCGINTWPMDINDDGKAGLADILAYIPVFGYMAPGPPYSARFDLNADNTAGLADILIFIPFFNLTCGP